MAPPAQIPIIEVPQDRDGSPRSDVSDTNEMSGSDESNAELIGALSGESSDSEIGYFKIQYFCHFLYFVLFLENSERWTMKTFPTRLK
jgi:hypothetical protein